MTPLERMEGALAFWQANAKRRRAEVVDAQARVAHCEEKIEYWQGLLVIQERYPELKSNENFLRLQDELAGTENRIAVERRRYNETLQDYNTYISLFPNSLVAGLSGFPRNDAYFKTDEGSRQAPKVEFNYGNKPAPVQNPAPAPAKP